MAAKAQKKFFCGTKRLGELNDSVRLTRIQTEEVFLRAAFAADSRRHRRRDRSEPHKIAASHARSPSLYCDSILFTPKESESVLGAGLPLRFASTPGKNVASRVEKAPARGEKEIGALNSLIRTARTETESVVCQLGPQRRFAPPLLKRSRQAALKTPIRTAIRRRHV